MEKTESYTFPREEVYKIFEAKLGKKISRIRFSPRQQTCICEVDTTIGVGEMIEK